MSLPFARPDIGDDEVEAVVECMKSGWLTSGSKVQEFEAKFAAFTGAKHAIAVSSATVGALLILDALGIGLGDEVIVPAMTFSGPAMMAHRLGANVVLADCLPGSHQLDPADVARKITPRTKVVMPTHFAGEACDLEALQSLCATHGVLLIDDAAHALPTVDKSGDRVGSGASSLATFFSFYATKTLTTGDGGMITTNEDWLAERIRPLRSHGMSRPVFDRYSRLGASWQYDIELHDAEAARRSHALWRSALGQPAPVRTRLPQGRGVQHGVLRQRRHPAGSDHAARRHAAGADP
ncbi:aminotransferase class I/II-fold pyridoxal phosphate-dependent enzyme [Hyphomicrobium sp.]|uniref:DegT/DnrJ/EryC1/StrS family aminotransferase n=1 Tax=Hyphomicrobium sp. TaxID=82 RepID=UPI001D5E6201|nr:aminotransferase class I/II-fold pyridoxal phosphate-dependent enzyme [Hyphomicrobium sp.]MBY0559995.1 DegT/DnrJ/EryC1/StrS family aminotransferase [Hyphomicrobium sp.]